MVLLKFVKSTGNSSHNSRKGLFEFALSTERTGVELTMFNLHLVDDRARRFEWPAAIESHSDQHNESQQLSLCRYGEFLGVFP